jgi:hypothetical protein
MRIKLLYIALPVLLISNIVSSQEFSDEQKKTIAAETDKLLENYQKYGAFSENGANISTAYVNNFKNLFKNTTNVYLYNDIDPEGLLDTSITVMEYIFKVQTWYPDGLDIDMSWDASLISEPVSVDGSNQNYVMSILLQKQVMGVYQSKKIQNNIVDLYFLIGFEKAGRNLRNFKIAGIQKERPVLEKPEEKVVAVPRIVKEEVIFVSIFGRPLYSMIYSKDIFSDNFWKAKGGIGYSAGLQFLYLTDQSYGVYAGLSMSNYKSFFKLENFDNEGNSELLTDKDGDDYYRYVQADVEEWNSLSYIDLSLGGYYALNNNKEITPYISAGAQLSFRLVGKYKIEGSSTHMGYYPKYHVILYDLEDYDFTSDENIKSESTWEVNPLLILAYFSCGLRFELSNIGYLYFGPSIVFGLTDLKYDTAKHRDDYISTVGIPSKTNIMAGGINLSLEFTL